MRLLGVFTNAVPGDEVIDVLWVLDGSNVHLFNRMTPSCGCSGSIKLFVPQEPLPRIVAKRRASIEITGTDRATGYAMLSERHIVRDLSQWLIFLLSEVNRYNADQPAALKLPSHGLTYG